MAKFCPCCGGSISVKVKCSDGKVCHKCAALVPEPKKFTGAAIAQLHQAEVAFQHRTSKYREIDDLDKVLDEKREFLKNITDKMQECRVEIEKSHGLCDLDEEIGKQNQTIAQLSREIDRLKAESEKFEKQSKTAQKKLAKERELVARAQYAVTNESALMAFSLDELDEIAPSVLLKLHYMDMKDLRKAFRDNAKQIDQLLTSYSSRYTTKANKAIYQLMVIALQAELQNILHALKYEKLDNAIEILKKTTQKYLAIASDGNQNIAGSITRFVGEVEYLFINAIKIEYNYYVKKEQARQEQIALREQMRQEAEERKALEQEQKRIEAEEAKYKAEVERLATQMAEADEEEKAAIQARMLEVESQLSDVIVKKDEVARLQHGKAGTVYIISNLGSFGDKMFKIGMTRRLDPQDRINELGSASVPFSFDVHGLIFSNDAVGLEYGLHTRLADSRVNKVNRRKEFFYSTVDELESVVLELDPTAEFTKTMAAEDYHQSISTDEIYSNDFVEDDEDAEDE